MDLSEVPADALLREMGRRLECLNKPEKRIILVGACGSASWRVSQADAHAARRPARVRQGNAVSEDQGACAPARRAGACTRPAAP
jgi:hypothetical protein